MSVIKKPDLKIFAQDAKTGEIETFPDVLRGWGITLDKTAGKPPLEWFNAIGKRVDEWLMYLTQRGVAEWDAALSYPKTAIVQWNGVIYVSNKETKGEQPDKSQAAWSTLGVFLGLSNYYTKTDTDTKFQPKGDYATNTALKNGLDGKFDKKGGALDGNITAEGGFVSSRNGKNTIALKTVNTTEPIITVSKDDSKTWQNHMFPDKSGTLMHVGDYGIGVPIALTASDNLGKIIKPGNYIQKYTGQATIANEYPIERAGTLMVTLTADGNVLQEYRAHNSSALIYYRSISDTGASANVPWISQYNTGNTTKDANGFLRTGSKTALITDNIVQATGTSTTNVMSQKAVTDALQNAVDIDMIYPVGIVTWFAQNKNPNTLFPGTKWQYIGENKTIRLANSSGNNVLSSGGSDTVMIDKGHLPAVPLKYSGTTVSSGGHTHNRGTMNISGNFGYFRNEPVGMYYGASGAFSVGKAVNGTSYSGVNVNQGRELNFDASKAWIGETSNSGAHTHSYSGNTENLGSGTALTVINAYIMLMGWYRIS
ncbi:TPA: hypothetical protein ACHWKL_004470 [Providencia stuartii]|uniref:phage baseplate protein n=1 Tax=Providencia stuartii TaxID=588 RepID=UPI001374663E|nr:MULTISPECIES: hypothetical protein [Providencia]MCL8327197.1 hypothetical protein [Providencia thailandensis]MDF4176078.1 hypothetical protein [Providencia thailandensis]MDN0008913.1 hypothetical protein [Providencia stuartii]WIJ73918.1 hypothetical protein OI982_21300 [Providencia thailandensis]CAK6610992.1 hypothetical protein PSTU1396_09135 [Providencia stuartii]